MPNDSGLTGLFAELKRRRVFRALAIYMAAAFVALQVADLAVEPLELPVWTMKLLWVLAIAGLPVVIGLAWAFDLPHVAVARPGAGTENLQSAPAATARPAAMIAVVVIVALGVGGAGVATSRVIAPDTPMPVRFAFDVEPAPDYNRSVAVTPDGRTIVYAGVRDGVTLLYRRSLDSLNARPRAGTERANQPAIAPDGGSVAFVTTDGRLKRGSIDGGSVETLLETRMPAGLAWSAEHGPVLGMPIYSSNRGLNLLPLAGDTALRPVTQPRDAMHHEPFVLADGETVLHQDIRNRRASLGISSLRDGTTDVVDLPVTWVAGMVDDVLVYADAEQQLMAVELDVRARRLRGRPIRVAELTGSLQDAVLTRDGTLVMRLAPRTYQLVVVDERGNVEPLLSDTVLHLHPRSSAEGRVLLVGDLRAHDLWMLDAETRALTKLRTASWAEWMPDGRQVIGGHRPYGLRTHTIGSGDSARALTRGARLFTNSGSVSPDGQYVALGTGVSPGEYDIQVLPLAGDTAVIPFATSEANEYGPRFSPDGRWIVYVSDESGKAEVYVRPFPGSGVRTQVSDSGGGEPVWSHDGRRIFYRASGGIVAAELSTDAAQQGIRIAARRQLFEGDFMGSDADPSGAMYDVLPDGRFIMARALPGTGSQMVVWMDWLHELKARLAAERH